jgi:hypothetical protein
MNVTRAIVLPKGQRTTYHRRCVAACSAVTCANILLRLLYALECAAAASAALRSLILFEDASAAATAVCVARASVMCIKSAYCILTYNIIIVHVVCKVASRTPPPQPSEWRVRLKCATVQIDGEIIIIIIAIIHVVCPVAYRSIVRLACAECKEHK